MDAVSIYLDVNVLVPLFVVDSHNDRADKAVNSSHDDLIVTNLSAAEFSAVVARRVRTRDLSASEARTAFANFDTWCSRHTSRVEVENTDIAAATSLMRRLDLPLRTPDAIHIAIVQRLGSTLLTFDSAMTNVARALGVEVVKS